MSRLLWMLAALALVLVPTAQATLTADGTVTFSSPSRAQAIFQVHFSGTNASDVRQGIDGLGDQDGNVSADEVADFEAFMMGSSLEDADNDLGSDFTVDGKASNNDTIANVTITGAEGPATSTATLTMSMTNDIQWPVTPAARHDIFMAGAEEVDEDDLGLTTAKIVMPPGYQVEADWNPPPGATLSSDRRTINVESIGALEDDLDFAIVKPSAATASKEGGGLPGVAHAGAMASLAVAVLTLRRRAA